MFSRILAVAVVLFGSTYMVAQPVSPQPVDTGDIQLPNRKTEDSPASKTTQVRFVGPSGMQIQWYHRTSDGRDTYSAHPLVAPARCHFQQSAVYRLKLSDIPGRPGLEVYPQLQVLPASSATEAFLSYSVVTVDFSDEDFAQVVNNKPVVKAFYLPNLEKQKATLFELGEVTSTKLKAGMALYKQVRRLGSILVVIRMGNLDE